MGAHGPHGSRDPMGPMGPGVLEAHGSPEAQGPWCPWVLWGPGLGTPGSLRPMGPWGPPWGPKLFLRFSIGTLSRPDRASYGVWRDVIWIKLKLSARSTRLDGSQHPDIVSNGRLWRNNAEHMKKMTKKSKKMIKTKVVELFFPVISVVEWR